MPTNRRKKDRALRNHESDRRGEIDNQQFENGKQTGTACAVPLLRGGNNFEVSERVGRRSETRGGGPAYPENDSSGIFVGTPSIASLVDPEADAVFDGETVGGIGRKF